MMIEIELPEELEKYKDYVAKYVLKAIKDLKIEDDLFEPREQLKAQKKLVEEQAVEAIKKVKINGKTWKELEKC